MGQMIGLISCKGGAGATTLTALLGASLARAGHSVCLVDACAPLRTLDIALNLQSRIVYDLGDVLRGDCSLTDALCGCEGIPSLKLLSSPVEPDSLCFEEEAVKGLVNDLFAHFDVVLTDLPCTQTPLSEQLMPQMNKVLLVSLPETAAQRTTEAVSGYLHSNYGMPQALAINGCPPRKEAEARQFAQYLDVPLLLLLPYTAQLTEQACGSITEAALPRLIQTRLKQVAEALLDDALRMPMTPERRKRTWFSRVKE